MVPSIQPQLPSFVARAAAEAGLFKPGQVLEALVLGKTPEGLVALKIGDMVINAQLPQTLPPGTTLQLQVKSGGPSLQLAMVGAPQLPAATVAPAQLPPVLPLPPVQVVPAGGPPQVPTVGPASPPTVSVAPAPSPAVATSGVSAPVLTTSTPAAGAAPVGLPVASPAPPSAQVPAAVPLAAAPAPSTAQPAASASPPSAAALTPIGESPQVVANAGARGASSLPSTSPQPVLPPQPAPTAGAPVALVANPATGVPASSSVLSAAPVAPPVVSSQPAAIVPAAPVVTVVSVGSAPSAPTLTATAPSSPAATTPVAVANLPPAGPTLPPPTLPVPRSSAPGTPAVVASSGTVPTPAVTSSPPSSSATLSVPPQAAVVAAAPLAGAPSAPTPAPSTLPASSTPSAQQSAPVPVVASTGSPSPIRAAVVAPNLVPAPEQASPSPLLVAQGATRLPPSVADLPRPAAISAAVGASQPAPPPTTPAAALAQMVPEAMARQNSIAPLLTALATIVAKPGGLPEPVLRAALQVLGQRVQLAPSGPTAQVLEAAIAKSGVYLEAGLAKGAPVADLKAGLVALKGALATWLGGNPAPVTPAQQVAPPLRGMPPRVERVDQSPLPEAPREAARALHSQADAALSRVKLMQLASLPDADPVRAQPQELRLELPFLIGHELVMAQFQVTRDGARRKSDGKRGWTMRFAMNFAAAGEVGAEVGLIGKAVNVALWAADHETHKALEAALPELAPALAAIGLEPGAVRVRALPPETPRPSSGQYLDSRR